MPSHKQLSNWYAQLGQYLGSGVIIPDALRLCEGLPQRGRFKMADQLERGDTFASVMSKAPRWLPRADRQFMVAASETGSLPQTLQNLSDRHATIGATKMKIILGMAYPVAVLHVAAMLLPVVKMIDYETGFQWDFKQWLEGSSIVIIPLWLVIIALFLMARTHSPWLRRLLRLLPILRAYSIAQSMADFAYALGTFIAAGVPVPSAWRLSVKLANDPRYMKAVKKLEPTFAAGQDPSNQLKKFKCFPPDFTAFYSTGAQSGKLDTNLLTAGRQYQQRANNAMTLASLAYPSLAFAAVAGIVIMMIFKVYGGYIDFLNTFLD